MAPALRFVLLIGLVLTSMSHAYAHDGGSETKDENGLGIGSCQCKDLRVQSKLTTMLKGIWCHLESCICSCGHDTNALKFWLVLHKPFSFFTRVTDRIEEFAADPPSFASPVQSSPSTFLARKILAEESHHAFRSALSPSNSSSAAQRPTTRGYTRAPHPSAKAPDIEASMPSVYSHSPGPLPHTFQGRRHDEHHLPIASKHSPSPEPAPKAAHSPVHKHPITVKSPPPITVFSTPPDCSASKCLPPLTKASLASSCRCVRPIDVEIELSMPLYTLFPLISVLAEELAKNVLLSPSQVEIVGANASGQSQEFSVVDINFIPLQENFDILTANTISQKFWSHEVVLNRTFFGNYTVAYVHYPGLPPSPPSETYNGQMNGMAGIRKPFAVEVIKNSDSKLGTSSIVAIGLSSVIALAICSGAVGFILLKHRRNAKTPACKPGLAPARSKKAGGCSFLSSDLDISTCLSLTSSAMTHTSTARVFTLSELCRATDQFAPENIIGEGGFGRVFCGVLDDGTKLAVKVLTRDHQEGVEEFISEVEMLSRLHHRNLVKLIGICIEGHTRCLVYELIANGSVEFHLHGKNTCPLDWGTRMKIALGSARGLAYLHEDSSPRVIHRDFKAGNILLEKDFNPKISDFGLAKIAPDGGSRHLSTRVMGTFGYVAPEYAMTGHLLVKSDVYSYGVVLLELLTGRKPVDMSQPPGQENLVTWARPLLTSKAGLQALIDPVLRDTVPYDSLTKVVAIALMCVHPEVSHRPFMGEVVQALKLVCNDIDVTNNGVGSSIYSQGDCSLAERGPRCARGCLEDDLALMSLSGSSEEGLWRAFSASQGLCDSVRVRLGHASSS